MQNSFAKYTKRDNASRADTRQPIRFELARARVSRVQTMCRGLAAVRRLERSNRKECLGRSTARRYALNLVKKTPGRHQNGQGAGVRQVVLASCASLPTSIERNRTVIGQGQMKSQFRHEVCFYLGPTVRNRTRTNTEQLDARHVLLANKRGVSWSLLQASFCSMEMAVI
jgi:hypothetical protein